MRFSFFIGLSLIRLPLSLEAGEKKAGKSNPQAVKALKEADALLRSKDPEKGIEKLQALIAAYPDDPAAAKAKELLIEYGVGEEVRVTLVLRETFREKFKIPEPQVLDLEEKTLKDLRGTYKVLKKPFYKKSQLRLVFYESQARYRKGGGEITSAGHFAVAKADAKNRSLEGKIEWYFPREAGTVKDRQTFMKGLICHESVHYLNAIHFGGAIPSVLDEGIADYLASRLNTEYYQYYRATDRERYESNARLALNAIAKYDDFVKMLESSRGFGQGSIMVSRWYGLCYAIVDFLSEGEINSKKISFENLLTAIEGMLAREEEKSDSPKEDRPQSPRAFVEALVQETHGVKLEAFHKELVKYILARYKQK